MIYDPNGNLSNDGTSIYEWNARDQLTAIKRNGIQIASFEYDALGRRKAKTVNGVKQRYVYDGLNIVQELPATGKNTEGNIRANYLSGGLDENFARQTTSSVSNYLRDGLGSTIALTGNQGDIQAEYTYTPYGGTSQEGSADNPFQYTGRENDGTGLYYYRARYYSPTLQRFISEDPIGLNGGINTYGYVSGNPISYTDPMGLCKCGDIAATALKYRGSTRFSRDDLRDNCHGAVYGVLKEAGAPAPERLPWWIPGEYPLGAGTDSGGWGDRGYNIDGWLQVSTPQVGDVVSADGGTFAHHLGIVVLLPDGTLGTMNLSSDTGIFKRDGWPFNMRKKDPKPGDGPPIPTVIWRCTCK